MYIQNIDNIGLKGKYIIYDDNTALLYRGKIKEKIEREIDEDVGNLYKWLLENKLTLNTVKLI